MEPIRVLHIVTKMDRGGLETMIMNYYRNIDRSKVQFDFIVHRNERGAYDDEIEALGGKIFRLPRLVPWSNNYKKALYDFFIDHPEYKVVHVHQDCLSAVALKVAKRCGVKARIAHSHNSNQDKNLKYLIKLFYKRFIPQYATTLFACGKEAGDWMFGGAEYKIINNAIETERYIFNSQIRELIRSEFGIKNELTVGLIARFSTQKNHIFLLEIIAEIHKFEPSAKLLLVGDGELRKEIEEKISVMGLSDNVILTGVRTDVSALLSAMDVFVMPSLYEGLSLSIVEAQASGLPCFISDRVPIECKITDLVEQLSLTDSPKHWAKEILKVKEIQRKNTYQDIALSGFDIKQNAKWLENFYCSYGEKWNEK